MSLTCEPRKDSFAHTLWLIYEKLPALKSSISEEEYKTRSDAAWRRYFNRHPQSGRMPVFRWRQFREFILMEQFVDRAQEFLKAGNMTEYCSQMELAWRKFVKVKNDQLLDGKIHPDLRPPGILAPWKRASDGAQVCLRAETKTCEVQVHLPPIEHRRTQVDSKDSPAQTVWDSFQVPAENEVAPLPWPFKLLRPEEFLRAEFLNGGFRRYCEVVINKMDKRPSVMQRIRLENKAKQLIQNAIDSAALGRRFSAPVEELSKLKSLTQQRAKCYRSQACNLLRILHSRLCRRMALKRSQKAVLKPRRPRSAGAVAKPAKVTGALSLAELRKLAAARKQEVQPDGRASVSVDLTAQMFQKLENVLMKNGADGIRTPKTRRNVPVTYRIWSDGVARQFFSQAGVGENELFFNAKEGKFFKPIISKSWPLLLRHTGPNKATLKAQLYYSIS